MIPGFRKGELGNKKSKCLYIYSSCSQMYLGTSVPSYGGRVGPESGPSRQCCLQRSGLFEYKILESTHQYGLPTTLICLLRKQAFVKG